MRNVRKSVVTKSTLLLAGGMIGGLSTGASAQLLWTGNGPDEDGADGNWSNPANWDGMFEPNSTIDAVLNNGDTILINLPGEVADTFDIGYADDNIGPAGTGTLRMTAGSLTASNLIRFGTTDGGSGNLDMTGGTMETTGGFNFVLFGDNGDSLGNEISGGSITANIIGMAFQPTSEASLTLSGTGELIGRDNIEIGAGRNNDTGQQGTATVTMTGGTMTTTGLNQAGDPTRGDVVLGFSGVGVLNMSGGTINSADNVVLGIFGGFRNDETATDIPSASGTVNQTGGTVNGNVILVGEGGNGTYNQSAGTVNSNLVVIAQNAPSTGAYNLSGGTLNTNRVEVGRFSVNGSFTQSGDSVVNAAGADFFGQNTALLVGDSGTGTASFSDNAQYTSNAGVINVGAFAPGVGTVTQSDNSAVTARGLIVGTLGQGTYNMNGGTLTLVGSSDANAFDNLLVGRDGGGDNVGTGRFNHAGGTVNVAENVILGDFDDSSGTYHISGGALNITGDLRIGSALASNAAPDDVREEPADENDAEGQALNATGHFIVDGAASDIFVGGNLVANPADKSPLRSGPGRDNIAILEFIFGADGVSTILVDGVADLDGATIDLEGAGDDLADLGSITLIEAMGGFQNVGGGTTENVGTGQGFLLADGDDLLYSLDIEDFGVGGGQRLIATLIPEPTALAGVLCGAGLLLRRRRA